MKLKTRRSSWSSTQPRSSKRLRANIEIKSNSRNSRRLTNLVTLKKKKVVNLNSAEGLAMVAMEMISTNLMLTEVLLKLR